MDALANEIHWLHSHVFNCQQGFGNPKVALCAAACFNDAVDITTERPDGGRAHPPTSLRRSVFSFPPDSPEQYRDQRLRQDDALFQRNLPFIYRWTEKPPGGGWVIAKFVGAATRWLCRTQSDKLVNPPPAGFSFVFWPVTQKFLSATRPWQ